MIAVGIKPGPYVPTLALAKTMTTTLRPSTIKWIFKVQTSTDLDNAQLDFDVSTETQPSIDTLPNPSSRPPGRHSLMLNHVSDQELPEPDEWETESEPESIEQPVNKADVSVTKIARIPTRVLAQSKSVQ